MVGGGRANKLFLFWPTKVFAYAWTRPGIRIARSEKGKEEGWKAKKRQRQTTPQRTVLVVQVLVKILRKGHAKSRARK